MVTMLALSAMSFTVGYFSMQRGPRIQFESLTHDFGTIPWSSPRNEAGLCQFRFTNTGDEPLIIIGVRASCGCTAPRYTSDSVMPGETGLIEVQYDNSRIGAFSKSITVTTNTDPQSHRLIIKGNVVREDHGTPVNPVNPSAPTNR